MAGMLTTSRVPSVLQITTSSMLSHCCSPLAHSACGCWGLAQCWGGLESRCEAHEWLAHRSRLLGMHVLGWVTKGPRVSKTPQQGSSRDRVECQGELQSGSLTAHKRHR